MKKYLRICSMIIITCIILSGCTSNPITPDGEVTPNNEIEEGRIDREQDLLIRLGVIASVDAAPIYLAEENGYFDARGLDVEIELFTSNESKENALKEGTLDGAIMNMLTFLNEKKHGLPAKIASTTDSIFPVVVRPGFEEKEDITVGVTEKSTVNYLVDKYLYGYNVEKIYITELPVALEMVIAGDIDMTVLPEPMASMAELKGATKRIYSEAGEYTPNVIIFTEKIVKTYPEAIKAFKEAYNQAVVELNNNTEITRAILIEELDLEDEVAVLMDLPTYNTTRLPSESFVKEIEDWTEKLQGEELNLKYKEIVIK